jgi:hypothetical protein
MRGLSNFQGGILLAERGMTQEARTIIRSGFEGVFYLGAIKKESNFADMLVLDDFDRRKQIARSLLKLPTDAGLSAEQLSRLTQFLRGINDSGIEARSVSVIEVARLAGMSEIYDTYYRGLSNDAAHPSITALNRHVEAGVGNVVTGLRWGPDVSDVGDTVNNACTACVYLVAWARDLFDLPDIDAQLESCWKEYKRLIQVQTDSMNSSSSSTTQSRIAP